MVLVIHPGIHRYPLGHCVSKGFEAGVLVIHPGIHRYPLGHCVSKGFEAGVLVILLYWLSYLHLYACTQRLSMPVPLTFLPYNKKKRVTVQKFSFLMIFLKSGQKPIGTKKNQNFFILHIFLALRQKFR